MVQRAGLSMVNYFQSPAGRQLRLDLVLQLIQDALHSNEDWWVIFYIQTYTNASPAFHARQTFQTLSVAPHHLQLWPSATPNYVPRELCSQDVLHRRGDKTMEVRSWPALGLVVSLSLHTHVCFGA